MLLQNKTSSIQAVHLAAIASKKVSLFIKREDELHPFISGNKYRKLKYNLEKAKQLKHTTLLTFGGAYSNHIAATAAAGNEFNFKTIGIIRGNELANNPQKIVQNPTLQFAAAHHMRFKFISRTDYRNKTTKKIIKQLTEEFGNFYLVPEGGTNTLAVKGCEEILDTKTKPFNYITCAVGTGGTISGIINALEPHQEAIGFPALKGDFLSEEIKKYTKTPHNWQLNTNYNFGGYAKISEKLIRFINNFKQETNIALDPVYTGKMLFGLVDLIKKDYFKPHTKILAIHTGGLQGIEGMNKVLKNKKLPLIQ